MKSSSESKRNARKRDEDQSLPVFSGLSPGTGTTEMTASVYSLDVRPKSARNAPRCHAPGIACRKIPNAFSLSSLHGDARKSITGRDRESGMTDGTGIRL